MGRQDLPGHCGQDRAQGQKGDGESQEEVDPEPEVGPQDGVEVVGVVVVGGGEEEPAAEDLVGDGVGVVEDV